MRHFTVVIALAAMLFGGCGSTPPKESKAPTLELLGSIRTLKGHSDSVCAVAFSPSGMQMVSGGADGKIKFWDLESGTPLRTLDGHHEWVHSVTYSTDGKLIASGGRDNLVKLWDADTGALLQSFTGHSQLVKSVSFSPDGQMIASCGMDKLIRLWKADSGETLKTLGTIDSVSASAVAFTHDSRHLLFGGDSLQLWNIESGECIRKFPGHSDSVGAIAISQDGNWFASAGSYNDSTVKVWDAKTGKCLWNKDDLQAWSLAFVSSDELLISGHYDGSIRIWDRVSGKYLGGVKGHTEAVSALSVDSKGQRLVSGSWDKCIKLWKLPSIGRDHNSAGSQPGRNE